MSLLRGADATTSTKTRCLCWNLGISKATPGKSPDIFDSNIDGLLATIEARVVMEWGGIVIRIFTVRGLYESERLCAILSLKNQTGTVIEAWIGLLMFIGVPFVMAILWRLKVATVVLSAYS